MIGFKIFLTEAAVGKRDNHNNGVRYELSLAKALHPGNKMPDHFRSDSSSPSAIHAKTKLALGNEVSSKVDSHAKNAANKLLEHLHSKGHPGVIKTGNSYSLDHSSTITWTSNPKDYEMLHKKFGTKDINYNSAADIVITHKHPKTGVVTHAPISLKYGQTATEKGPGLESLGKHIGSGGAKQLNDIHNSYIDLAKQHIGSTDKGMEPNKQKYKDMVPGHQEARKASLMGLSQSAKIYHEAQAKSSQHKLHSQALELLTSEHSHEHYRVHTNDSSGNTSIRSPHAEYSEKIKGLKIHTEHVGSNVHYFGTDSVGNKKHLLTVNFKKQSSPFSSTQAVIKKGRHL